MNGRMWWNSIPNGIWTFRRSRTCSADLPGYWYTAESLYCKGSLPQEWRNMRPYRNVQILQSGSWLSDRNLRKEFNPSFKHLSFGIVIGGLIAFQSRFSQSLICGLCCKQTYWTDPSGNTPHVQRLSGFRWWIRWRAFMVMSRVMDFWKCPIDY